MVIIFGGVAVICALWALYYRRIREEPLPGVALHYTIISVVAIAAAVAAFVVKYT